MVVTPEINTGNYFTISDWIKNWILSQINIPEHIPGHTVPLDVAVAVVIGSIISLGLTTLTVLAILHVRSKLFETIRLSIYDAEKPNTSAKTNETLNRNTGVTSCDYGSTRWIFFTFSLLLHGKAWKICVMTLKLTHLVSTELHDLCACWQMPEN